MDMSKPLIDQIDKAGQSGWEFITQAQKIIPGFRDLKTGMPKIEIVLIYKQEIPESC